MIFSYSLKSTDYELLEAPVKIMMFLILKDYS